MKKSLALALAVLTAGSMLLGSCGKKEQETKDGDALASKIVLATGGNTGTYYAYGMAMGSILQEKTGIKFDVQSTGASKANIQLIQTGEADMAVVQNDVMYYAYTGTDLFNGAQTKDFSAVATLYPELCQIIASKESGIQSVADLAGKRVGILACSQSQRSMQQRYTGVSQGLRESGAVVEWSLEGKAESIKDAFYTLEQDKPVDILIALGNDETEMMVDFFAGDELGWRLDRCSLYGVGSSEKNVYYLDKGWIQTLVVPNEFNMGYQSMEAIAKQLIYHMDTTRSSKVNYLVVDREHLYDADIQKVLFPIVQ